MFQAVVAKQYDMNTRFIKATFVDNGDKIYIDPNATVKVVINALRPDGEANGFDGEVNQDGTVTVPLHSWMLELVGTVTCDISVIDTEADDNKKLTTTSFTLLVEKAAFGGEDIADDPQYDVLVDLLARVEDAAEKVDKDLGDLEKAVDAAETAAEKAETKVESLIERNHKMPVSMWVGTQEEYDAITEKDESRLYIINDDEIADHVIEQGGTAEGSDWGYRKWHSGLYECWTNHVGNTVPVNTPFGSLYKSPSQAIPAINYPIRFANGIVPVVTVTLQHTNDYPFFMVCTQNGTVAQTPAYDLVYVENLGDGGISASAHVYAIGHWK